MGLQGFSVDYNAVSDVSPLGGLKELRFLSIDGRLDQAGFVLLHELYGPMGVFSGPCSFGSALASLGNKLIVGLPGYGITIFPFISIERMGALQVIDGTTGERIQVIVNPSPAARRPVWCCPHNGWWEPRRGCSAQRS